MKLGSGYEEASQDAEQGEKRRSSGLGRGHQPSPLVKTTSGAPPPSPFEHPTPNPLLSLPARVPGTHSADRWPQDSFVFSRATWTFPSSAAQLRGGEEGPGGFPSPPSPPGLSSAGRGGAAQLGSGRHGRAYLTVVGRRGQGVPCTSSAIGTSPAGARQCGAAGRRPRGFEDCSHGSELSLVHARPLLRLVGGGGSRVARRGLS